MFSKHLSETVKTHKCFVSTMTNVQKYYVNMNIQYTTNKKMNCLCNSCMLIVFMGIEP